MARERGRRTDRCLGATGGRNETRWARQPAPSLAQPLRRFCFHADAKTSHVRPRPRGSLLRYAGNPVHRPRCRKQELSVLSADFRDCEEHAVPDEEENMNFVTKKHLSRRTLLRGLGVSVSLPLLDSMLPAQTPLARTAAVPKTRLSCIYVPHGATMDKWTPAADGKGFEFTEILTPLEKLRDRVSIVSNLAHPAAGGVGSDAGADHARSAAVFLSGVHPEQGSIHVGTTIDQIAAQ